MRRDGRLSVALHVLLHMSELHEASTSEKLASLMKGSPVVLRRTMAGLRDAGMVSSEKGHGGGFTLARKLSELTLADVLDALRITTLFSIGLRERRPKCLLEQAVNGAVGAALDEAEALLVSRLRSITVAEVLDAARKQATRRSRRGKAHD